LKEADVVFRYAVLAFLVSGALLLAAHPRPAAAIPVFANGAGGVSCELCHSAPPNLNAYGRYILATNFARALDAHKQMQESLRDPISVAVSVNQSNTPDPTLPPVYSDLVGVLAGGYFGPQVTYYASVPIVEGGFPSSSVDQVWAAYNGIGSGNGSLQVGKFPTPIVAPWLSQSLSLSGYTLAAMPVGLNTAGVGDNRWGASYSQIGHRGLIGTAAFVTNTGTFERAFDSDIDSGGEGQGYVGSLQFMAPQAHFTGGFGVMSGTFPLPSGAKDLYNRQMALVSYSTSPSYSINAMALIGHDQNPNDGETLGSGSNGWSFETIYSPRDWVHLDLRYERTNDGLGTIGNNYVTDVAFNPLPNLIITLENVSAVGARPLMSYQILWAGPWIRHPFRAAPASPAPAPETAATNDAAAIAAGKQLYGTNCAACHGADGQGGVGPNLHGIAKRMSFDQTVGKIENPSGVMPKLYPGTLSAAQVNQIAAFIRSAFP
jgi:mono/diheme cytochrome c family protein